MKPTVLVLFCVILFSCHGNISKRQLNLDSISKAKELNQLKDIADLKMLFLDGSPQKVIDLFGQPDTTRESPDGSNGCYVYYDMVKENNVVKTLVISYHFNDYDVSDSGIKDIIAANDGETVVLSNGTITIKKPIWFSSQYHDVDNQVKQIDSLVKNMDTTKITFHKFYDNENKDEVKSYIKDNVTLLKVVFPIGNGDFSITGYYFIDKKLRFKIEGDKQGGLLTNKSYILNNRVVKFIRGNEVFSKVPSNYAEDAVFNEYSIPYQLFNKYAN